MRPQRRRLALLAVLLAAALAAGGVGGALAADDAAQALPAGTAAITAAGAAGAAGASQQQQQQQQQNDVAAALAAAAASAAATASEGVEPADFSSSGSSSSSSSGGSIEVGISPKSSSSSSSGNSRKPTPQEAARAAAAAALSRAAPVDVRVAPAPHYVNYTLAGSRDTFEICRNQSGLASEVSLQALPPMYGLPDELLRGRRVPLPALARILREAAPGARLVLAPLLAGDPEIAPLLQPAPRRLPRLVHFTVRDKSAVLPHQALAIATWAKLNPGYSILLFDDADIASFMAAYHPRHLALFKRLASQVERTDLWRYLVLCTYGGVYADSDVVAGRPVDSWAQDAGLLTGVENAFASAAAARARDYTRTMQIVQWTIAARPGHPAVCRMGDYIAARLDAEAAGKVREDDRDHAILERTGPGIWSSSVHDYLREHGADPESLVGGGKVGDVRVLPQSSFGCASSTVNLGDPVAYAYHMFKGSWRQHESDRLLAFVTHLYAHLFSGGGGGGGTAAASTAPSSPPVSIRKAAAAAAAAAAGGSSSSGGGSGSGDQAALERRILEKEPAAGVAAAARAPATSAPRLPPPAAAHAAARSAPSGLPPLALALPLALVLLVAAAALPVGARSRGGLGGGIGVRRGGLAHSASAASLLPLSGNALLPPTGRGSNSSSASAGSGSGGGSGSDGEAVVAAASGAARGQGASSGCLKRSAGSMQCLHAASGMQ